MDDLSRLIVRAQEGDRDAFGQIYNLFYKRIYRYCQFNIGQRETAQDLCQETFLRAWKTLPSFSQRQGSSFQAYLFRISHNLVIDSKRKKKEIRLAKYQDVEEPSYLDEQIERQETSQKLKEALAKLHPVERQIIVLRYFEEMTTTEVARVVGLREGTLRVRAHRVLKKLKQLLEELT